MKSALFALFLAACAPLLSFGEPFINLDFNSGLRTDPMPGWTSDNSYIFTSDNPCLGAACVIRFGVPGNYSLLLQSGVGELLDGWPFVGAAISQTGDIPIDARSIRMESRLPEDYATSYENLLLSINGQNVPLVPLSVEDQRITIGANINEFAGGTVELIISTKTQLPPLYEDVYARLFNVSFSINPVPEPSTLLLLAVIGVGNIGRRKSRLWWQ